jgi:hypothetical protein
MPCPWLSFVAQGGKPQPSQHSNFHMAISLSRRSHRAGMGHLKTRCSETTMETTWERLFWKEIFKEQWCAELFSDKNGWNLYEFIALARGVSVLFPDISDGYLDMSLDQSRGDISLARPGLQFPCWNHFWYHGSMLIPRVLFAKHPLSQGKTMISGCIYPPLYLCIRIYIYIHVWYVHTCMIHTYIIQYMPCHAMPYYTITLHRIAFHCITLHYIALHYIT